MRLRGASRSVILRGDKNVIWGREESREGGREEASSGMLRTRF